MSTTYFAELTLRDGSGATVSRNVYWLSTRPDVLNAGGTTWWYTPTTSWADLTGLAGLPRTSLTMSASSALSGGRVTTTVTLANPAGATAVGFFAGLEIRQGPAGAEVLPVTWSDNDVTLWPGESVTLQATYASADLHGAVPTVDLSGWNVAHHLLAAPVR